MKWALRNLNWLIAACLFFAGIAVIRWPHLTLDTASSAPTTAATLAGALFGAAALFMGSQINELQRQWRMKGDLQEQRRRVRAALSTEFVRISVNMMKNATQLLSIQRSQRISDLSTSMDLNVFAPLPSPVFDSLRGEILSLSEADIDVLYTFYSGLDATRRAISDASVLANSGGSDMAIEGLLPHIRHDLQTAAEVARKIWPTRKVEPPGEESYILAQALDKQAGAILSVLSKDADNLTRTMPRRPTFP